MKCNMCNTSKVAKVESRTGLGGGYKDRDDVVEYKERDESDDEFDEVSLSSIALLNTSICLISLRKS